MAHIERNGKRKTRDQLAKRRVPELGYYFIVTDTEETEQNYMYGLRDSIPRELQGKLVIKVIKTKSNNLVDEARNLASVNPQYGEIWIIFDRDEVKNFDEIIRQAKDKGISVGWTNPCIEEWFNAYFGVMPTYQDSVACCNGFAQTFKRVTGQKYTKSDKDIYNKLNYYGDEEQAIKLAEQKYNEHMVNERKKPTEMCPGTTLHCLVREIKSKISKER